MAALAPKSSSSKPTTKPPSPTTNSLSTHLAMVDLKHRLLTSLSKLSDRDTHQIALSELQFTLTTLTPDALPMVLNTLFTASSSDPKPSVRSHSLRLIAALASAHPSAASPHLPKISSHLSRRLRDQDPSVRDACRSSLASLSATFLDGHSPEPSLVSVFLKPLLEALADTEKTVQIGAAMCLGKVVECAKNPPVLAFQKLCPRVCKSLNNPNFSAKSALLPVISVLSQVGAIAPQSVDSLLQSVNECLTNTDWATRKAAAETLTSLALHSSDLVKGCAEPTLTALEACRFDKIKPVRDSMAEALQQWKKIETNSVDVGLDEQKTPPHDKSNNPAKSGFRLLLDKIKQKPVEPSEKKVLKKETSNGNSPVTDSTSRKDGNITDKTVGLLKKKIPALTDKELNPEFFQKLEKRGSNDLSVDVVVSQKCPNSSTSNEREPEHNVADNKGKPDEGSLGKNSRQDCNGVAGQDKWPNDVISEKDLRARAVDNDDKSSELLSKPDSQPEGSFVSNKGNWSAIQRQLLQLERQQTHLMNMLQDFMGGSHNSMITLENRVRGLERVVEEMVHDLSFSAGRRGNNSMFGFEGSSRRNLNRYNGIYDYNGKFGRSNFGDGMSSGMRGRNPYFGSRIDVRSNHLDDRSSMSETEFDDFGSQRAWNKGIGRVRLGEGPSARSVWQASKDEATLEAIRVAGEEKVVGRAQAARVAIPEMTAEAMGNDDNEQRDPVWIAWGNAMDAVHMGDMETAYAEVLSIEDDFLLVKLMDRSGPVLEHLSNEIAVELLNSISQLVLDQNLFDLCVVWIQQLVDFVMEDGPSVFGIPMEIKQELLFNFHEASSTMELPEDWEGVAPEQLVLHLTSAWNIKLQHGN